MNMNLDSFIKQQEYILSQFPNSFQESERNNNESDVGVAEEFVFKPLPKFKHIKTLSAIKTIGNEFVNEN